MKVYFKSKKRECIANGEYDEKNNKLTIYAGAKLSKFKDEKFRMAKEAEIRYDKKLVKDYILQKDIIFKSPSVAAQFIACSSLNGLKVWKNEDGIPLGKIIKGE